MSRQWVISLCDLTGTFVKPWVSAGFNAMLVDPQHEGVSYEVASSGAFVMRVGLTINEAMQHIGNVLRNEKIAYVAGWPPCTDVALSGTKHWAAKREADPYFQAKAALVAEQCRTIGGAAGCPWHFENPKSAFSSIFGPPNHKFHPWHYCGIVGADCYNKETWLWTGGGFKMPERNVLPKVQLAVDRVMAATGGRYVTKSRAISLGLDATNYPDDRIHYCPPGPERANIRSATPLGFSIAVYEANKP